MIRKFYGLAWFLLIGSAVASIFTGSFDALTMLGVSLGVVGLVYGLALWAVLKTPEGLQTH